MISLSFGAGLFPKRRPRRKEVARGEALVADADSDCGSRETSEEPGRVPRVAVLYALTRSTQCVWLSRICALLELSHGLSGLMLEPTDVRDG